MTNTQQDTIIAAATPPGSSAIALIRLSGSDALKFVDQCFYSHRHKKVLKQKQSHTLSFGYLMHGQEMIDEVVVGIFKAPHSYTGEDIVEISCHGSPYIQEQIIHLFMEQGARLAGPGEFTLRAFLNHKMDLTKAEAVADLIASNSKASHRMAITQLRGGFGKDLKELRQQLIDFAALIELELDFSEEDVEFADRQRFVSLINHIQQQIKPMMDSFKLGNAIKNGVPVAIAGKPNAGKSTLLNALLNEERAIVSPIAGTTRDTIEELLNIDGVAYRFIDTAGLRATTDTIEQLGVERSYEKIKKAELLLYVIDINTFHHKDNAFAELEEIRSFEIPYIIVANKADTCKGAWPELMNEIPEVIAVAAKNREGIDELKQQIGNQFMKQHHLPEGEIISNARHYHGLRHASKALDEVLNGIGNNLPTEMIAFDVRTASHHLAEITGDISNNDILDSIFTRFCIGK